MVDTKIEEHKMLMMAASAVSPPEFCPLLLDSDEVRGWGVPNLLV
jgi:hypothetical protein